MSDPIESQPSIRRITHTHPERSVEWLLLPAILIGGAIGLCGAIGFAVWVGLGGPGRSPAAQPAAIVVSVTPSPIVPTPTASPTATPPPLPAGLTIGGYAQVNGTDGDSLRLRSDPGLQTTTLGTVPEGVVLLILDGPRPADNINWWRLRNLVDGGEGWAAELYLIPARAP